MKNRERPFDQQVRANEAMARVLRGAGIAALVLGALGTVLPGPAGTATGWAAVGFVVATPLGRVAWLAVRWVDRRDWLFAGLATTLLAVVVLAGTIAMRQ
ncbi:DUF1634 domain-containing protein [Euzebya rosea]|uniref:DUF1634 domain-containing protein n=1 Tax=Euzebya rosea TaxID=2052804 RepID=UPI000D3EA6DD|nr:DUF1634 domain-containing protein [Euzebya rosea]